MVTPLQFLGLWQHLKVVLQGQVGRRLGEVVLARLSEEPVLALHGPRSVGKSTLLRETAERFGVAVIDLDDLAVREAFRPDPGLFVAGPAPVCIDEYQHVPETLDAIKAELNRRTSPGRFVITGSTRHDALPSAAQALTGRLHLLTVLPLTQGEIAGVREDFVEGVLQDPLLPITATVSMTSREDYVGRVCAGGFPLALQREGASRARWFDDYVRLTLSRDVAELAPRLRQAAVLPKLLERLAAQTGQLLNVTSAADAVGMDASTAEGYLKLLEAVYLVRRLPSWGKTLRSRVGSHPKLHVVDSGLAARLLRVTPAKLAALNPSTLTEFGHLLETFVVGEVLKQVSWLDAAVDVGQWHTRDGDEVDLVIETEEGDVVAFEVKAAGRVPGGDLKGLRKLRDALGERFKGGYAMYTGQRSYTAEDRLHVIPIERLWTHHGAS